MSEAAAPFQGHHFKVTFEEETIGKTGGKSKPLCDAAFSECSGIEANLEPFEIEEGGFNRGAHQRVGRVSFNTVVLKRGLTKNSDLWKWWELVTGGKYAYRLRATVELIAPKLQKAEKSSQRAGAPQVEQEVVWRWILHRCLPIKIKAPDLAAAGVEVGIEELHLMHEGLELGKTS